MAISDDEFQTAAAMLGDLMSVVANKGADGGQDMTLLNDAIVIACRLAGPPWNVLGPVIAPKLEFVIIQIVENNRSAEPGALVPIASGKRGS